MKKLLIVAIVAVSAAGGIVGYHQAQRASHQELSALMLANIEALSAKEGTGYVEYAKNCLACPNDVCVRSPSEVHWNSTPYD